LQPLARIQVKSIIADALYDISSVGILGVVSTETVSALIHGLVVHLLDEMKVEFERAKETEDRRAIEDAARKVVGKEYLVAQLLMHINDGLDDILGEWQTCVVRDVSCVNRRVSTSNPNPNPNPNIYNPQWSITCAASCAA